MSDVRNNAEKRRYELEAEGETAFAVYRREGGNVVFVHTVVPPALEGRGIGSALVKGALEDVRREGLKAVPLCAFVKHYMDTHAEVQDLRA
jgi:predicted GNAT family acetyltransferase